MSSFKRKSAKHSGTLPGTRPSPGSVATLLTSTGIPSLDDVLGGGLPLSCSLLVAAPDPHSSYGELVQKYFIVQGLVSSQDVLLIDDNPLDFVKGCMWTTSDLNCKVFGEEEEERSDERIKIAWRYESMKQFQTTVGQSIANTENFCRAFDLTSRIPDSVIQRALYSKQLEVCDVTSFQSTALVLSEVVSRIEQILASRSKTTPLRICLPALGSPGWGDSSSEDLLHFLRRTRMLVRRHTNACLSISLPPHLSVEDWSGRGWIEKIGWSTDALITLAAFTANPSMTSLFPSHHGLVHIHTLPAPFTFLPPSDKFSLLRGLSAAADSSGSGENNLAFKCTRKRFIIETMHLDLEGGISERRTNPSSTAREFTGTKLIETSGERAGVPKAGLANVEVELEEEKVRAEQSTNPTAPVSGKGSTQGQAMTETGVPSRRKVNKPKKKVGFQTDRPDVYDF
ncbi:hypothetical protein E1B28_001262 [Marasmius oreades]|uniref:Elongator complex protein 4 n=1 Tax=Marasmius oreades TaxID=181124 RepID=A0A9P7V358_9AGAR|nr:uncharacterized protein E1B28_001262 [Marasmius oreades]KAG7099409.1 hypothetical protein E1B28_001262 [Marasmius oreades]